MYATISNSDTDRNNNRYNVYKWHNNGCYIRWRKMIEKLHINAFVKNIHLDILKNCQICKKYILNTIFTYENIYRCINTNFTYSLHIIQKNHNRTSNRISYTML